MSSDKLIKNLDDDSMSSDPLLDNCDENFPDEYPVSFDLVEYVANSCYSFVTRIKIYMLERKTKQYLREIAALEKTLGVDRNRGGNDGASG